MKPRIVRYALSIGASAAFLVSCAAAQMAAGPSGAIPQAANRPEVTSFRLLHRFSLRRKYDSRGAAYPIGGMLDVNNMLYGSTSQGGGGSCSQSRGCGAVFSLSLTGKYATLYGFPSSSAGEYPNAALTDVDGTLYGTTFEGGYWGDGNVFSLSPSGQETTLHDFTGESDGAYPAGGLINVNGTLYGATAYGGRCFTLCGTVYKLTTSGGLTVLHDFPSKPGDAQDPNSGLTAVHGTMYGTTAGRLGAIYSITASGTEKVLYEFLGGAGGQYPHGLINVNGTLYGTAAGGSNNDGIAYSITATGKLRILYNFAGGADGSDPAGDLVDDDGTLYGVTSSGGGTSCGGGGCGTIFRLTMGGTEKVLYRFSGGSDGASPDSTLARAGSGLYGTTQYGGDAGNRECKSGCGVAFELSP